MERLVLIVRGVHSLVALAARLRLKWSKAETVADIAGETSGLKAWPGTVDS